MKELDKKSAKEAFLTDEALSKILRSGSCNTNCTSYPCPCGKQTVKYYDITMKDLRAVYTE